MSGNDSYQRITDRILALLDAGTVPWRKPWRASDGTLVGLPRNIRGTPYRGINALVLGCAGYSSPVWMTYKQAQERGGHVRRGERAMPCVFWRLLDKTNADGEHERIPLLRVYSVFNAEQTAEVELPVAPIGEPQRVHQPIDAAERVVAGYARGPMVKHGSARAYYTPSEDVVTMPEPSAFDNAAAYYSTLLHELTHSTGHRTRLARDGVVNHARFADHAYAAEELVAEMGAAFLCGTCGLDGATIDASASYIDSWRRAIGRDPRLVVTAAAQAQRAADWILGLRRVEEQEPALAKAA